MNQQVRLVREHGARCPCAWQRWKREGTQGRLMIREIGDAAAGRVSDAIADGRTWMAHVRRGDPELANIHLGVGQLVQVQVARKLAQADWKQRGREISHETGLQVEL